MKETSGELKLMVVSYPRELDRFFEQSVTMLASFAGEQLQVIRCQRPNDVPYLAKLWRGRGFAITRLCLVGHGKPGAFALGDEVMFGPRRRGLGIARALGEHLDPRARVQLLGCRVAAGDAQWLAPFERALGGRRTLWACDWWLTTTDFAGGLSSAFERRLTRARSLPRSVRRYPRRPRRNPSAG